MRSPRRGGRRNVMLAVIARVVGLLGATAWSSLHPALQFADLFKPGPHEPARPAVRERVER
jgi:hypothetical protein